MRKLIYVAILGMAITQMKAIAEVNCMAEREKNLLLVSDTAKSDSSDDATDDNKRSLEFGLEYATDQANRGVHDVKLPYLSPSLTYTAKSGFFIDLNLQYLLLKGKKGGFDVLDINPGWDIDLSDNTTLDFNYSHYFFRKNSPNLIRSSLSNSFESYIDQSVGKTDFKLTVAYDTYNNGASGDFVLTPDISHTFKWKWGKASSFSIIPEGSVDLGTQNFYSQYRMMTDTTSSMQMSKGNPKTKPATTAISSAFGAIDYSLILTLKYKTGGFAIEPAFTYNAPLYQQIANVSTPPIAFFTLNLTYTIE